MSILLKSILRQTTKLYDKVITFRTICTIITQCGSLWCTSHQISIQVKDKNIHMHKCGFIISNYDFFFFFYLLVRTFFAHLFNYFVDQLFKPVLSFSPVSGCAWRSRWEVEYGGWQDSKIAGASLRKEITRTRILCFIQMY